MEPAADGAWRWEEKGTARAEHGHGGVVTVDEAEGLPDALEIDIRDILDAMDTAVYSTGRWPLVVDPEGRAATFFKYQNGAYIMANYASETESENLRRVRGGLLRSCDPAPTSYAPARPPQALIGCIQRGSMMMFSFGEQDDATMEPFLDPATFPEQALRRADVFKPEVWTPLLRDGDPKPDEFLPRDEFKVHSPAWTAALHLNLAPLHPLPAHLHHRQGSTA